MVLECVMLCIDNSEYSRNGDYSPSRFQSEVEACSLLAAHKLQSNPETAVGLLSLAGNRVDVHVSPCRSSGAIMSSLSKEVKISGHANFVGGLKTAALALKNRQNKNQRQRIIAFVGSPVTDDVAELIRVAKVFKKNNIAVDLVNFGAENAANENPEKLEQFIAAVNNADNSHLVNVPPGPHILADLILSSSICVEGGAAVSAGSAAGGRSAAGSAGGASGLGDADPNLDPELAMAIRMSYEDERQRQMRATEAAAPAAVSASSESVAMEDDEEALLAQAIAMSMQAENQTDSNDNQVNNNANNNPTSASAAAVVADSSEVDMDQMQNPDFLNELLSSVGATDSLTNDLLGELTAEKPKEEKKDDKNEKK